MKSKNPIALVTGAGGGIGRAIALQLAKQHYDVVIHFANSAIEAAEVVALIKASGQQSYALQADLQCLEQIDRMFIQFDLHSSHLDVLVNNAGVLLPASLDDLTESVFDRIISTNVKGTTFLTQAAVRRMAAGGRIVSISSSRAHYPAVGSGVYAASKAAIAMLSTVWAKELAKKGITVNTVAPGPTSPGMFDRAPAFLKEQAIAASPFTRIGSANEIANVVGFLCSPEAGWLSGQTLVVNGAATI